MRDILLLLGGAFLLYKGTMEIHNEFEVLAHVDHPSASPKFLTTIIQIGIFDLIFSLDSVLTAIGLTQKFIVMAIAISMAVLVMLFASELTSRFIQKHPSIRMLAWSFLLLIGTTLIADALKFHIPRGYIYFSVCFSLNLFFIELLNCVLT